MRNVFETDNPLKGAGNGQPQRAKIQAPIKCYGPSVKDLYEYIVAANIRIARESDSLDVLRAAIRKRCAHSDSSALDDAI